MDIIEEQGYSLNELKKLSKKEFIEWYKKEMFGNDEEALYNYENLHDLLW